MKGLIERLERATGPDRELDAAVCEAAGYRIKRFKTDGQWHYCVLPDDNGWNYVPAYTSSLDAALTLVPESERVLIGRNQTVGTRPWAQVGHPPHGNDSTAPTLPLALCIAALHAKSAQPSGAEVDHD